MGLIDGQQTRQHPATREPAYRPPPRPLRRSSSRNIAPYPTSGSSRRVWGAGYTEAPGHAAEYVAGIFGGAGGDRRGWLGACILRHSTWRTRREYARVTTF